jgi:hypothetical protein
MNDSNGPRELAKGTPRRIRTIYAYVFFVAAILSVLAFGLSKVPPLVSAVADSCRALYLCSPPPLKPLSPLATGWLPPGST